MKYIDIHCHLGSEDFDTDRQEILGRMEEEGVGAITIGADLEESKKAVEIAETNENIWATIGVHPGHTTSPRSASQSDPLLEAGEGKNSSLPLHLGEGQLRREPEWDEVEFEKLIKSPKIVAIGECGLDHFKLEDAEQKVFQKKLFVRQIEFALKHDKPLMLHIRDAYNDAIEILSSYKKEFGDKLRGDIHFFAGNIAIAQKFLDLGFMMSFTGVITFARNYDEVIKYIPNDHIMSETDAPWVAPVPWRGKRNEPLYVIKVVEKMAEIKDLSVEAMNKLILDNANRMFGVV